MGLRYKSTVVCETRNYFTRAEYVKNIIFTTVLRIGAGDMQHISDINRSYNWKLECRGPVIDATEHFR